MDSLFGSVRQAFERLAVLSDACGGCEKKDLATALRTNDPTLAHIFAFQTLDGVDAEASRATQRGMRLMQQQRTEDALREFHDARQLLPTSHLSCCNLACAYHLSSDDNAALFWYREAFRMSPRCESAVLALSVLEHCRGQADEAQRLLVTFLRDVDPTHVGALRQLGRLHQAQKNFSKAAGCYHQLIALDPTNPEWSGELQACLDQVHCKDEQGKPVQNPNAPVGMFARAFSFAEPVVRSAAPVNAAEALSVTGKVSRSSCPPPPPAPPPQPGSVSASSRKDSFAVHRSANDGAVFYGSAQLRDAARLRADGRPDAALEVYRQLMRSDRNNADAILGSANCYSDKGDFRAAIEAAKQLLGVKPDDAAANLRVAELLLAAGQGAQSAQMAEPYLKRATADSSKTLHHRILCCYAELALAREDHSKALASAAEAVRVDASSPKSLLLLGICRIRVAEYPAALRALAAASSACQDGAVDSPAESIRLRSASHALAAQANERLRKYSEALEEADKALDVDSHLSFARVVRAVIFQQLERCIEAESELNSVLQRDSRNVAANLQMGYLKLCVGDAQRAIVHLESVVGSADVLSKSGLGTAKVYLALSLDTLGQNSQRVDSLVRDSIQTHINLKHVWNEIDSGAVDQPTAMVQRLRGICDLDLTSQQARQLLALLVRCSGRSDLTRSLASMSQQRSAASSRRPSVPPCRWAPSGPSFDASANAATAALAQGLASGGVSRLRSASPAPWPAAGIQQLGPSGGRGRSSSPGPYRFGRGYPSAAASGASTPGAAAMTPLRQSGGRAGSKEAGASGASVELSWHEIIRPEQLIYGSQLGAGGSAQVYRGSWNGHEVAIKKISGVAHLEEMTKEINALRRLRHPRLVRFMGACIQPPLLLVVTEFMAGGSLHDRLFGKQHGPPLQPQQRWTIAVQMLEGLVFLHSQRVVHRDLKSMNILLDASQNAKICDFGLAQQMEATHIVRRLEGEGGSPRYMAPECYDASHGKLTEKVDVWAMACILLELFSGVLPYADCSTMAQLSARILVERRPPDVPAFVPAPLVELLRRCLVFDPAKRMNTTSLHAELCRMRPAA